MTPRRFYHLFTAASVLAFMLMNDYSPIAVFGQGKKTANIWTDPVVIERKPKANRKYIRKIRQGQKKTTPLLTIQWQLFKQDGEANPQTVDPDSEFYTGDGLQLVIKANQSGFIYILDNEGKVLFPNPRINAGKNTVTRNYPITIPSNCEPQFMKNKRCWWYLNPPVPENARETLFVIFSRDAIQTLPNNAQQARERVKKQLISEIKSDSPNPETVKPRQRFVTWVTNSNPKDNEELVATLYISHLKPKNQ
jgi:hypothetical protein